MSAIIGTFFKWLVQTSWQAAVLVLIVFLVQLVFRGKLSARWRHALWLLVVARLLLPAAPRSAISLFNYAGLENLREKPALMNVVPPATHNLGVVHPPVKEVASEPVPLPVAAQSLPREAYTSPAGSVPASKVVTTPPAVGVGTTFSRENIARLCALVWGIGAGLLALRVIGQNLTFVRRLRGANSITEPKTLALFEQCKSMLGIHFSIGLVETSQVQSPALHGFFRPRLLLPAQMIGSFSKQELRYIFLHELAHVKRCDMALLWAATLLKILHWFNPVLWLGFRRMATDRELACDEMALSHAGEQERKPYGAAIIKVLETCVSAPALPGVMGILEDKDQMSRRISMILKFRQRSPWSMLAIVLLLALGLVTLTDARNKAKVETEPAPQIPTPTRSQPAQAEAPPVSADKTVRPDLMGHVRSNEGSPVKATVFIYTAGPKVGSSTFCPSCYADCRKNAKSDAQGGFKIDSLDPQLQFRILVVAKGYAPKFVGKVDPAKGPVEVKLKPIDSASAGPERTLRGRVVDSKGHPVEGAVVNSHGIHKKNGQATWGTLSRVDPLAVTDEQGEFVITSLDPFESMDVKVEARALANKTFTNLGNGDSRHDLVMTEGATVTGRVMFKRQPLKNVSVGMVSVDRGMENYTGNFDIGTDSDGRFAFVNLPPNVDYYIYGMMKSLKPYGAVPIARLHVGSDGETTDAGDLLVVPGHRLAGRVVLSDGKPVPRKTRLLVSREQAWDSMQLTLAEDGGFETTGIPAGKLSLSVEVPGYSVAPQNASLDRLNPYQLVGLVDRDITNLVFLLAKGKGLEPDYGQNMPESSQPWNRPLQGTEGLDDHSNQIAISGHVVDAETKQPIAKFRITPGQARRFGATQDWLSRGAIDGTNGSFIVYFDNTIGDSVLKAEAEGFLPATSPRLLSDQTNYDFALTRGSGPSGTVLLPNGKPAEGVSVFLVCAGAMDLGFEEDGRLRSWQNQRLKVLTGASGRFSFSPELQMESVIASGPDGFTWVSLQALAGNSNTVVLNPWGKIKGKLLRPGGAGKGEDLDTKAVAPPGCPDHQFFLGGHTLTDSDGGFEFDRVPAGVSDLSYRIVTQRQPMIGWRNETLQQVTITPGKTLELTINAPARLPEGSQRWGQAVPEADKPTKSGPLLKAVVLLPDGTPAAGVEVASVTPGKFLSLHQHTLEGGGRRNEILRTTPDGSFALGAEEGTTAIVAVHEKGFARVPLDGVKSSGKIVLQPWGRIEGVLHIGSHLGTNEVVAITQKGFGAGFNYDYEYFQARTDSQGRFVLRDVPPGQQTISRTVSLGDNSWGPSHETDIIVKAGETTHVELGGNGLSVVGQAVLNEAGKKVDWTTADCFLATKMPAPPKFKTMQEQQAWWMSDLTPKRRIYRTLAKADGSFRIEDVPPGDYELMITISQRNTAEGPFMKNIASGEKEVTVAKSTGVAGSSPVDLGTISVKVLHTRNVGDMAAPLEAKTLNGQPLRLADYNGKNVLLVFGALMASSGEINELKEISNAFAKEKNLVLINISLDPNAPELAKDTLKNLGLGWVQGVVIEDKRMEVFENYFGGEGVPIPFVLLIDSDGKIIAKDLRGADIKDALAKALAKS